MNTEITLLWDADTTLHGATRCSKEESEDGFIHELEDATFKFDEAIHKIVGSLEEQGMIVENIYTFISGYNNFRKILYPTYKKKRSERPTPPMYLPLKEWVIENYQPHISFGVEADDSIASYWTKHKSFFGRDDVVIASMDKDFKQLPAYIFDTYYTRFGEIYDVSEKEAVYNYYRQFITGDAADEYNLLKGKGAKFADNLLDRDMPAEVQRELVKELYQKEYEKDFSKMWYIAELLVTLQRNLKNIPDVPF